MEVCLIDGIEVQRSSGNVYADLGLPDAEKLKIGIHVARASLYFNTVNEAYFHFVAPWHVLQLLSAWHE